MKILHKSKRAAPPHPQVAEIISKLISTPNDDLPEVLGKIDAWKWPRSDLNAWIKVLNKFDSILEEVVRDYDVDKLQLTAFTPVTKKTLCEILRFERLLLENSTNRKMFNSYDRLNSLLFTSDLDVLVLSLNLLLRPSQQYSAQPAVSHALNISTPRLQSLAKRWPNLREYGVGLVELASTNGAPEVEALPAEARQVSYSFYRTGSTAKDKEKEKEKEKEGEKQMDTDVFDSTQGSSSSSKKPAPSAAASGLINIHIDEHVLGSKGAVGVLADAIEAYSIPDDEKFEVFCRIRSSMVLGKDHQSDREKLVIVRLLAIAIFGHTHSETQAMSSLFLFEPDLINHIAELLQLDRGIPISVQTAAIAALDALARYRGRIQEVLTAVNAGVNHGILMALVRKTVADVGDPDSTVPHSFAEALLSFVTFVASHAAGGNMVVGAGLVPLLIQVIENRLPHRLPVVSKTMQLVDNVLYSFTNAFQLFCTARGVEVLVERIEYEVDLDVKEHGDEQKSREMFGSYGELPVARAAVLKHILRSMHRMMQSSGTAEGLRGLIDMPILKSIKKIIEYRGLFGPSILPIAINIMSTFIHNEPTSLSIIQEAGLPETFYRAIEAGLEPSIEVIQAIPNAIGALCLNQAGQEQLTARPSIIPGIFSIFTSERHLKVLQDKENAVLIGTGIDELIRHHPALKAAVFESLKSTLSKIEDMGNAYTAPPELSHWYWLMPGSGAETAVEQVEGVDVHMEDIQTEHRPSPAAVGDSTEAARTDGAGAGEDQGARTPDNNSVVSFIDVLGRFLEGLFQHTPHCRDFVTLADGLERLGRFTALPCLPYDFAGSVASDSIGQVMRTMMEVATTQTLLFLSRLVKASLDETRDFWGTFGEPSKLLPLVDITRDQQLEGNQRFRKLVTLHIRVTLLSDVFSTAGFAHGRGATNLLQTLMGEGSPEIVSNLGDLHRVSIWENIVLKMGLSSSGIDFTSTPPESPLERSPDRASVALPETGGATPNGVQPELPAAPVEATSSPPAARQDSPNADGPREHNARVLKNLTHGLPAALSPFFQAIVKMFYSRRTPDSNQRKQILTYANSIADVVLKHVTPRNFDDKLSTYAYYSVMLGLLTVLMVDERTTQSTVYTLLLSAFHRVGGFDATFQICRRFTNAIETVSNIRVEDRSELESKELFHAYGGLKVALHLLQPLVTSKPIFESGQTTMAISRDKKDTDPDYFEPHNFLVRVRLASLPFLREVWEAAWLISAPLSVSRSVVHVVMELVGGDGEETKGDPVDVVVGGSSTSSAPPGPDEERISQLTDMGFPRSAVERALLRTRNNVNAATEFLLAHPFPFPPDPEPSDEVMDLAPSEEEDSAAEADTISDPITTDEPLQASADIEPAEAVPPSEPPSAVSSESAVVMKSSEEWRKALNEARDPLKASIGAQALRLVDEHNSLLYDLHVAFIRPTGSHQEQGVRLLVDDIKSFSPSAYDVQERPLANRCRLLALVLHENPSSVGQDIRSGLMDSLLALLLSNPVGTDTEHPTTPLWLAAHLLVAEVLLTLGDQPRSITLPKEGEPITREEISTGPRYSEARTIIFDFCIRLLGIPHLPSDELLSVLRLLVLLTRDHQTACQFVKRDGVLLLFTRVKASPVSGSQSYIAIILRHIVEEQAVVQQVMRQSLKRYFTQGRTRVVDVSTFLKSCSPMAFRDPELFIQVTESLCRLSHPYTTHQVSLKPEAAPMDDKSSHTPAANSEAVSTTMQVDQTSSKAESASPSEPLESVVHFLIGELMKTAKVSNDSIVDANLADHPKPQGDDVTLHSGDPAPEVTPQSSDQSNSADGTHDRYVYSCFLMQCLTELLFSYDSCKIAFLSYSPKKRPQTPAKDIKHRSTTLHFLLSELISFGTINSQTAAAARNRVMMANWAMSMVLALCVDSSSTQDLKDISSDLISVRKFVLESVNRAIKDLSPSEHVDARYGRLLALADLCYRLLTVRFNAPTRKQAPDEVPTHIAKVMLEKNFVATLTGALAEVDLNYPNVKGLVASILRPIEHLSKIAIKMSRASGKGKEPIEGKVEAAVSVTSESEEDESEDAGREETPDLYRNSSLGMFGGEMEEVHFPAEDEMDDEEEDEDEDVEMDYGEETGSEDTSNADEGEDALDNETQQSGDGWQDEDEEDEDLVANEDENDEDDDDDDDDDEGDADEEEEEMMWQDIQAEVDIPDDGGDDGDEDDEAEIHIPITRADAGNDPDPMSDEEELLANELGILDPHDLPQASAEEIFGIAATFANGIADANPRDGTAFLQFSRRNRVTADDVPLFGQARNAPPAPEATTHPLLLSAAPNSHRNPPAQSRSRRPTRGLVATNGTTDLLQTIEELIGGGAVQLFHHIISHGRGAPEAIRLDVPGGAFVNVERGVAQRRPGNVLSASLRMERAPRPGDSRNEFREFDPQSTLQRWADEVKTLHGEFVAQRLDTLSNHVILAMLPAAIEAAKQAKILEEQELAKQQEAQAKAEEEAAQKHVEEKAAKEAEEEAKREAEEMSRVAVQPETLPSEDAAMQEAEATTSGPDGDTVMSDASNDVSLAPPDNILSGTDGSVDNATTNEPGASSSGQDAPERITVMIHGSPVDITDTGIDPTFLEALPDDMREEVLNQHVRDQRAAIIERPADSQISTEFLEALPPELRAEIIQQERQEQARRESANAGGAGSTAVAAEMDPASFIASLDPHLRQAVLLDQDDGFIQSLPSHMLAEAQGFRDSLRSRRQPVVRQSLTRGGAPLPRTFAPRKTTPQHDAIQLLDKTGITVLVRLLFFPHVLKKTLLFRVLVNLCENEKTRTELFNLLLSILQDGTGDLAAVDKSFAQMSFRNSKTSSSQTPKSAGKQKAGSDYFSSLSLPNLQCDAIPELVAQRCLEGLTFIVSNNEQSSLFFLTEHELPAGLRRATSKKGKGKEKQVAQTHYPVVLLLGLLDRQSLLKTPSIMESVVGLLATVTRPLNSIKDANQEAHVPSTSIAPLASSSTTIALPAPSAPSTDTQPTTTAIPPTSSLVAPVSSNPPVVPETTETQTQQESRPSDQQENVTSLQAPEATIPPVESAPEDKSLLASPPQIPHTSLRYIVNILTTGECSGRTFQQSLALIQHLSYIPDARDVIAFELRSKAQEFGQTLLSDLDQLAKALKGSSSNILVSSVASRFSPASSEQAKLLRVLKTIDYMYSTKLVLPTDTARSDVVDSEKVQCIYESFRFAPLWRRLGDCLAIVEENPETEHIATVLLPLIEALMVVCKYVGSPSASATRALRASASPMSPSTPREAMEDLFVTFTDAHRKVLNLMVRNNPSLMSGSFSLLVHNPRVLDFDNKRNYFNQQLHRRSHIREHHSTLQLNVRRARVFEDSFQHLQRKTGDQIKYGKLSVRFYDEEGVDAGGVTREWFQILARQMFDPNNALFQPCAADRLTYQPNKNSWVNPEHLSFFKFVGRVIGKAIYDGRLLDAYFARSLYRQLLGKPVDYRDVEWVDPEYYNSLCWILENDPTMLDLTFSVEADEFGVNRIVSLKEGGDSLPVTLENRREFVQLSAQYRLYSSIKDQIENLLAGFYEIIPKDLVTIFNESELELLISGTPDIDVDEWRSATEYNGYSSSDPVIVWWWRALKSFNRDERAKVLSFATGTSRVPLSGFVDLQGVQGVQRFSIHRAYGDPDRLPQAHTCFNQVDLPQYSSYEMLRQQVLLAITEGSEGFSFA